MKFLKGAQAMLPITAGVIPFGLVMGTVSNNAGLDFIQTLLMNVFVFAGAAQLASVDLMLQNVPIFIVVATGLIINMRFVLYSAALSGLLKKSSFLLKLVSAYGIADQSYAVLVANQDKLKDDKESIEFYLGAALTMILVWQLAVMAGFIFGNFASTSLALDYAVPLSFVALVMPTLKNRNYFYVALFASVASIALKPLPYNLGLLTTGLFGIALGSFLTRKRSFK